MKSARRRYRLGLVVALAAGAGACSNDDTGAGDVASSDTSAGESAGGSASETTSDDTTPTDPETTTSAGETSNPPDDSGDTDDSSSTGDSANCDLPIYDDDLVVALDEATTLPGEIRRMASTGTWTIACGSDFVAGLSADNEANAPALALAEPCSGLAIVNDTRVLVSTTTTVVLAQLDPVTGELAALDSVQTAQAQIHAVSADEDTVFVAAGTDGMLTFTITDDQLVAGEVLTEAVDARDVAIVDTRLLVADGTFGLRLLTRDGATVTTLALTGESKQLTVNDEGLAIIGRGFRGIDIVKVDGDELVAVASRPPDGIVLDTIWYGDDIVANLGYAIVRYALEDDTLREVSRERRPGRSRLVQPTFLALARGDAQLGVALGDQLVPLTVGDGAPAPDIYSPAAVRVMTGTPGELAKSLLTFQNVGSEPAVITGWQATGDFIASVKPDNVPPERPGCPGQYVLAPDEIMQVNFQIDVTPQGPVDAVVAVLSDDPDEPEASAGVMLNRVTPAPGVESADLSLVTWHGEPFRLSDHRGDVMLIKLIAPS